MIPRVSRVGILFTGATVPVALGQLGCSGSEYHVEVTAHYPGDMAVANLEITALPFDRDALRDSLAAAHGQIRPTFPDLEAEMDQYSAPDIAGLDESLEPWRAVYDSVRHLADSLRTAGADQSPQYADAYALLRDQYRRLAASAVDREASIRDRFGKHTQLASRVAAAADAMRAWEGDALASFPHLADSAQQLSGREIRVATTNDHGEASFQLEPGRWWLVASWTNPDNPYREFYWNIGVVVHRLGPRSVPLFQGNGVYRWRY